MLSQALEDSGARIMNKPKPKPAETPKPAAQPQPQPQQPQGDGAAPGGEGAKGEKMDTSARGETAGEL